MASNIEYEEKYLALQKEYNQTLKDSVEIILKYTALQAKCERYEGALNVTKVWVEGALDNPEPEIVKCAQSDLELIEKALSGEGHLNQKEDQQ